MQGEQQCTSKQIEARPTNARARYANLTPEQRQAIRDRQRLLYANMTSEQKQAKRNREKTCRAKRRKTLNKKIYRHDKSFVQLIIRFRLKDFCRKYVHF